MDEVNRMRRNNLATVPSTIRDELATNPFLRVDSPEIRESLAIGSGDPVEQFAEIRRRKDHFH